MESGDKTRKKDALKPRERKGPEKISLSPKFLDKERESSHSRHRSDKKSHDQKPHYNRDSRNRYSRVDNYSQSEIHGHDSRDRHHRSSASHERHDHKSNNHKSSRDSNHHSSKDDERPPRKYSDHKKRYLDSPRKEKRHDEHAKRSRSVDEKYNVMEVTNNFNQDDDLDRAVQKQILQSSKYGDLGSDEDDVYVQKTFLDTNETVSKKMSQRELEKIERNKNKDMQQEKKIGLKLNEAQENCRLCLSNLHKFKAKHRVVALGERTYLAIYPNNPSGPGFLPHQCYISTVSHIESSVAADKDVQSEIKRFKQSLQKMFFEQSKMEVIFTEKYIQSKYMHSHLRIDCYPIPRNNASEAPAYFRQEMMSSGEEWSTNAKIVATGEKELDKYIPEHFSYFHVEFGLAGGLVHLIEDHSNFPKTFGQDIIRSCMDMSPELLQGKKFVNLEEELAQLKEFLKMYEKYDWTQELDA